MVLEVALCMLELGLLLLVVMVDLFGLVWGWGGKGEGDVVWAGLGFCSDWFCCVIG